MTEVESWQVQIVMGRRKLVVVGGRKKNAPCGG